MGCDTIGRIKGYVSPMALMYYIKHRFDVTAKNDVERHYRGEQRPNIEEYVKNPHSEDSSAEYSDDGYITLRYKGVTRNIFYIYRNVNILENLKYYSSVGLEDMVTSETTYIALGAQGDSVEIIGDIIRHFGGGWLHENDCIDDPHWIQ